MVASVLSLAIPRFTEYRGGVFLGMAFDAANVDTWFDRLHGETASVEKMVNHVHLWDVLTGDAADPARFEHEAALLLEPLAWCWTTALGQAFPGRQFDVISGADGGYGPELTFSSALKVGDSVARVIEGDR